MVEKRINDRDIIYRLTRKKDNILIIKYNLKNKGAKENINFKTFGLWR